MHRIPLRFLGLATVLVIVNVAGWVWVRHHQQGSTPAAVVPGVTVRPATGGDVDDLDRLGLLFDTPVAAPEQIGSPLTTSPFAIEPDPGGHWVYATPERLDFVLDAPLPPGRVFTIRSTPEAHAQLGRELVGETSFTMRTRSLALTACEVFSADRTHINLELRFNQPVRPTALARALTVTAGRPPQDCAPELLTTEPSEELHVRLRRPRDLRLTLHIDKDLTGHLGERDLGLDVTRHLTIDDVLRVRPAQVRLDPLGARSRVTVRLTRRLDAMQPLPDVTVSPPVNDLRVELRASGLTLLGGFEPRTRYEATLPATLRAHDGQTLEEPTSLTFDMPGRRPRFDCDIIAGSSLRTATFSSILTPST